MEATVCKFGGTSLATAEMFRQVSDIITGNSDRRYIVVSAPGKRFAGDVKVTDLLMRCRNTGDEAWRLAEDRFREIAEGIGMTHRLNGILEECRERKDPAREWLVSRGEWICGKLMAEWMGLEFVDAVRIIRFDENGELNVEASCEAIRRQLSGLQKAVVPGFYGAAPDGTVRILSRGGSDVTGALVAKGVRAAVYENWTDVDGIMTADPKRFAGAKILDTIGNAQMRLLSEAGAEVLHPDTLEPLTGTGTVLRMCNTMRRYAPGTLIFDDAAASSPCVAGSDGWLLVRVIASAEECAERLDTFRERHWIVRDLACADIIVHERDYAAFRRAMEGTAYSEPARCFLTAIVWDGSPVIECLIEKTAEDARIIYKPSHGCALVLSEDDGMLCRMHDVLKNL